MAEGLNPSGTLLNCYGFGNAVPQDSHWTVPWLQHPPSSQQAWPKIWLKPAAVVDTLALLLVVFHGVLNQQP